MAVLMLRELVPSSAGVSTSGDSSEPTRSVMSIGSLIGGDKHYLGSLTGGDTHYLVPNEVKRILIIPFSRSKTEWLKIMNKAWKDVCSLFKEIS